MYLFLIVPEARKPNPSSQEVSIFVRVCLLITSHDLPHAPEEGRKQRRNTEWEMRKVRKEAGERKKGRKMNLSFLLPSYDGDPLAGPHLNLSNSQRSISRDHPAEGQGFSI